MALGDATIKQIADYYNKLGNQVEILTGDESLKSYQPLEPPLIPRRRRDKN